MPLYYEEEAVKCEVCGNNVFFEKQLFSYMAQGSDTYRAVKNNKVYVCNKCGHEKLFPKHSTVKYY